MTTNEATLSVLEANYLNIEDEQGCDDCGYEDCRCDDDDYGDAWELGAKEEAALE